MPQPKQPRSPNSARKTLNKTQRVHDSFSRLAHRDIDRDFTHAPVPVEWHNIWAERDRRADKKKRVTISVDEDVLRFFRAMGAGYGPRMNRVLRAFMHDRLAGRVHGPEDGVQPDPEAELGLLRDLLVRRMQRRDAG